MKKIIILDSHYRTRTFLKAFEDRNIFLISVNKYEQKLAKKNFNIEDNKILDISNFRLEKNYNFEYSEIKGKLEKKLSWSLFEIINSDRKLKTFNIGYAKKYLIWIAIEFEKFINKHKINKDDIFFLEPTWAHEILISQISHFYNFNIWAPLKSKIIPDTFYFFKDWRNENYFISNSKSFNEADTIKIINNISNDETSNKIQDFQKHSKKNTVNPLQIFHMYRLIKELFLKNRNKHIHNSIISEYIRKIKSIFRFYYFKFLFKNSKFENFKNKKIIYFPLHYQPEASIDVIGYKFSDQLSVINKLSESIDTNPDFIILVKDHPHCVGNRKLNYFDKISNKSNVIVLSPWINSKQIIKNSELVITIAGTASLEASIMKVPSVTLVKMFFANLMIKEIYKIEKDSIIEILKYKNEWIKYRNSNQWLNKFMDTLNCSFHGNFGDSMNNKKVLDKQNMTKLKYAVGKLLNS